MWCKIWCDMIWKCMIYDMIWLDRIYMIYDGIWMDRIYDKIWWYDMMWYDMIKFDMMWFDVMWDIRYDMIFYVMKWYMLWYDTACYDMIYDMIYHIWYMIWYDMIWYMIWYDMMRYDKIRYDTIQNRSAMCSLVINIKTNRSHWLLSVIHYCEKGHCDRKACVMDIISMFFSGLVRHNATNLCEWRLAEIEMKCST